MALPALGSEAFEPALVDEQFDQPALVTPWLGMRAGRLIDVV
jgi:hypothetical protein